MYPEEKLGGFINLCVRNGRLCYRRIVSRHAGRHEMRNRLYIRHILYSLDERVSIFLGGSISHNDFLQPLLFLNVVFVGTDKTRF
jgi:hypothetical protein